MSVYLLFVCFCVWLVSSSLQSRLQTTQPIIGISESSLDTFNDFALNFRSLKGDATVVTNLTTVGVIFPQSLVYVPDDEVAYIMSITSDTTKQYITRITPSDGHVTGQWTYSAIFSSIEYDMSNDEIFVAGYDPTSGTNYLFELDTDTGGITQITQLPAGRTDASTYCPKGHMFFVTIQGNDGTTSLVKVDIQNKIVVQTTPLVDNVQLLLWDYSAAEMYAIVTTGDADSVFVTIDVMYGNRTSTIQSFPTLSPDQGAAILDVDHKIVYASLLDLSSSDGVPTWVVLDVTSGQYAELVLADGIPIDLAFTE